ncbi:MAG TPA: CDP-diacylglycerol--glycerol-3-phosphate 3-phosphatidyltransferase [Firmicutes bacterium]|nr:CDP-diacylglycerol--glycerol-3-phosphate 3-phosphatidyltransferase [Bacillota bacterium]
MNLPNKLTVLRMVLVPFFVLALLWPFPHHYLVALILFGAASYTDHLDGKLARKNNQITDFGKFMDPLADKILVISALVCFVSLGLCDVWLVLLIIAREFMVTSVRLVAAGKGKVIAANNWGKLKTVSQIVAICVILFTQYLQELGSLGVLPWISEETAVLFWCIGEIFLAAATLFSVLSGLIYLRQNWELVRTAK